MLAGAALNGLRAMACVRTHRHCRVELVSIVTTLGVGSDHRAAVNSSKRTVMLGEGGMNKKSKSGFYKQHCGVLELGETKAL